MATGARSTSSAGSRIRGRLGFRPWSNAKAARRTPRPPLEQHKGPGGRASTGVRSLKGLGCAGQGVSSVPSWAPLAAVYAAGLLSSCAFCAWYVGRTARRLGASDELKAFHQAIAEARSWNSRLLGTIRWAGQTVQPSPAPAASTPARPSAPAQTVAAISQAVGVPVPPEVARAAAAGGMEEVEVPDALVNIARGAGIDIGKVLAGDDAEMAKAKTLLNALGERNGAGGSIPTGGFGASPGLSPGETYL